MYLYFIYIKCHFGQYNWCRMVLCVLFFGSVSFIFGGEEGCKLLLLNSFEYSFLENCLVYFLGSYLLIHFTLVGWTEVIFGISKWVSDLSFFWTLMEICGHSVSSYLLPCYHRLVHVLLSLNPSSLLHNHHHDQCWSHCLVAQLLYITAVLYAYANIATRIFSMSSSQWMPTVQYYNTTGNQLEQLII